VEEISDLRIGDDYLESRRLTCRNSSVVDYYICSPCFFEYFCNFKVVDFSRLYSDVHSPLVATLLQFNELSKCLTEKDLIEKLKFGAGCGLHFSGCGKIKYK
jgi:hypothetical protein